MTVNDWSLGITYALDCGHKKFGHSSSSIYGIYDFRKFEWCSNFPFAFIEIYYQLPYLMNSGRRRVANPPD